MPYHMNGGKRRRSRSKSRSKKVKRKTSRKTSRKSRRKSRKRSRSRSRKGNAWTKAVSQARKELGITGFVAVKKGSPLYKRAKQIYGH